MSDTFGSSGSSGGSSRGSGGDDTRDEVLLDLDEDKLDTWEDVRGDYAVDPESKLARPAVSEPDEDEAGAATDAPARGGNGDDRVLVEGERHDDLDIAPDGTSADEDE